jgi:hypothetical protein
VTGHPGIKDSGKIDSSKAPFMCSAPHPRASQGGDDECDHGFPSMEEQVCRSQYVSKFVAKTSVYLVTNPQGCCGETWETLLCSLQMCWDNRHTSLHLAIRLHTTPVITLHTTPVISDSSRLILHLAIRQRFRLHTTPVITLNTTPSNHASYYT